MRMVVFTHGASTAMDSKTYFQTNLLFPSVRARSPGAVLGAGMITLSLCLESIALPLLSSPFEIRTILY
jgi:hypothetical protein